MVHPFLPAQHLPLQLLRVVKKQAIVGKTQMRIVTSAMEKIQQLLSLVGEGGG